jgi:hypothetical protein
MVETSNADGIITEEEVVVMSIYRTKCSQPHISYMLFRPALNSFEWVGFTHNKHNVDTMAIKTLLAKMRGVPEYIFDHAKVANFSSIVY